MRVLVISADQFEDTELLVPLYRLQEEGLDVDIASLERGPFRGKHGYEVSADLAVREVDPDRYALLLLPGGKAPATLRQNGEVLEIVRDFFAKGKPVAAICHGPQILLSAGVLQGRRATCYRTVADELRSAGVRYEDTSVVVDGNLVTSRQPSDLPRFVPELLRMLRGVEEPARPRSRPAPPL